MDNLRAGPTDPHVGPWGGARGASKKILLQRRKKIQCGPTLSVYCIQDRVLMVVPAPPINMKKLHTVR